MGKFSDICGLLFTLCGILEFGDRVCETAAAGGLSVCQPESGVTCILLPPTMMQGGDILNIEDIVNIVNTRSSWLNCALRDDEAVYWVSIGH